jgi:hypothetical protein
LPYSARVRKVRAILFPVQQSKTWHVPCTLRNPETIMSRYIPALEMRINWQDKHAVIALANKCGPGMSVIKLPERMNYNIIHTANEYVVRTNPRRHGIIAVIHRT